MVIHAHRFGYGLLAVALLLAGCQTNPGQQAAVPVGAAVDIDDLMPVDCLLPPRVKVLGNKVYTEARRPLKTTAADCRIRGGEFVAYDRADYRWALKVWLPAAEAGDPQAQTYVGEIYEKGLGTAPDYAKAFQWYQRAAAQGYRRAMLRLGRLYEKGLGVQPDRLKALNWYRRGSGLEDEGLVYAATLKVEVEKAVAMRTRELESQLHRLRAQARRLEDELAATRARLERLKREPRGSRSEEAARLEEILARQKQELDKAWLREAELKRLLQEKESEVARLGRELHAKEGALEEADRQVQAARKELAALYQQLESVKEDPGRVAALEQEIAAREAALSEARAQVQLLQGEVARMKAALAKRDTVAVPGPSLEIIEPPAVITRGLPQIRLRSMSPPPIVGRVTAPAGLRRLAVNGKERLPDPNGLFRIRLRDLKAETQVRVEAVDAVGRRAVLEFLAAPAEVQAPEEVRNPSSGVDIEFSGVDFGQYHALVIGIDAYRYLEPLRSATRDAQAVDRVLRERYGFKSQLLLNPTKRQIVAALADLHARLGPRDNLLIYYAGHGRLDADKGYWLPVEAREEDPQGWLPNSLMTDYLKIMKARHVLVIADSCYAGALSGMAVPRPLDVQVPERVPPKWVKAMVKRRSRNVLTSGGLEPVLDMGADGHSVFANALLRTLREGGPVMDGYRLYRRIVLPVEQAAARYGIRQTPTYAAILGGGISGEFFFVARASGRALRVPRPERLAGLARWNRSLGLPETESSAPPAR